MGRKLKRVNWSCRSVKEKRKNDKANKVWKRQRDGQIVTCRLSPRTARNHYAAILMYIGLLYFIRGLHTDIEYIHKYLFVQMLVFFLFVSLMVEAICSVFLWLHLLACLLLSKLSTVPFTSFSFHMSLCWSKFSYIYELFLIVKN